MILLIDPDSALLERSNILLDDPELDIATSQAPRVGHYHDVSLAFLGCKYQPIRIYKELTDQKRKFDWDWVDMICIWFV